MDKSQILRAIKGMTDDSGGKAPGSLAFERQTGIRKSEWYPHLWLRWGDALREAGFAANEFQKAIPDDSLIQKYIALTRALNHLPVHGELRRQSKKDKTFPSDSVFGRFGGKEKLLDAVVRYCQQRPGNDDIIALCQKRRSMFKAAGSEHPAAARVSTGFVYLMKSGRHYKIGHTRSIGSRERQLAIKIPVPPTTIHSIKTDDPLGVEAYWHKRFHAKRGEGEWFDLSPEDVKAFTRWKRIL